MKDKYKVLITIGIITILLIIYLIILLTTNNKNKPNELTTVTTTSSTSTTVETTTTTTVEETTTSTTVVATTTTKKTTSSTTKVVTTTSNTTSKQVTYSCPNKYELNNNKCIRKVAATLQCPSGYTDYSDNKCINLSEGYEINENDTCPDGYGYMMLLNLFGPNTYMCHPVKNQIYVCNEGTLKGNECIISIDAIAN